MLKVNQRYLPYNPKLKNNSRELRKKMTQAEKKLWYRYLRQCRHQFLRQRPIDNYIVDFYCSKLKLAIEVDGATHSTDEEIANDKIREDIIKSYGIKILRFNNSDIYNSFDGVCDRIAEEIK